MIYMKYLYSILFFCCFVTAISAQAPKREMRATWLATVWSLDWPKDFSTTPATTIRITKTGDKAQIDAQKKLMTDMLDKLESANINTVFFQIRGRCDAMYKSSYEPWSSDLVATRGMDPGYDPLEFVIEEGHKRGIEVHAWMNPYRFSTASTYWDGEAGDYRKTNPDWILTYPPYLNSDGKWVYNAIMDPAVPEVRQRITDIVKEVVSNYDVDGIVFDDYFYAYGGTPEDLDLDSQEKYKPENQSLADWRRENIAKMVASVYHMIQETKPYVTFGISPFGIWTTDSEAAKKEGIVLPPGISGGNMYDEIYCDPVAWLKEGTVDYISPQLYWPTTYPKQDYRVLCPWWSDLAFSFKRHFYSSHSVSGIQPSSYTRSLLEDGDDAEMPTGLSNIESMIWKQNQKLSVKTRASISPEELGLQIDCNRKSSNDGAPGSAFYSTQYIINVQGVIPYLQKYWYAEKALVPAIDWKVAPEVTPVSSITLNRGVLHWVSSNENVRYTIYGIPTDKISEPDVFKSSRYLLGTSYTNSFVIPESVDMSSVTFAVAVFDRYGNEYTPVVMNKEEQEDGIPATLTYPVDGKSVMTPFDFTWEAVAADWYTLEIAEDENFTIIHSRKNIDGNELSTNLIPDFESGKTYYWRVVTHKAGYKDAVSSSKPFIPVMFAVTSPEMGSADTEVAPVIEWRTFDSTHTKYIVLVASEYTFDDKVILYSEELIDRGTAAVPEGVLLPMATYYVKVKAILNEKEVETRAVSFTTKMVYPDVPVIVSPVDEGDLSGNTVLIKWAENIYATGFQAHLSKDPGFPIRGTTSRSSAAFKYEVDYGNLATGTYYVKVRANYKDGQTDWSPVVKFNWLGTTSVITEQAVQEVLVLGSGVHQLLKVNVVTGENTLSVSLFDVVGNERRTYCLNRSVDEQTEIALNLGDFPKGIYLLRVVLNGQLWTLKLLN